MLSRTHRAAWTAVAVPTVLTAGGAGLRRTLTRQVAQADRKVRPLVTTAPPHREYYGDPADPPITLALLGDSSAEGVGVHHFDETLGGHLGRALAEHRRYVRLLLVAVNGATAAALADQIVQLRPHTPDLAVISIGANDVRARTAPRIAAADLGAAVAQLRVLGAHVVVGTTPDLGIVTALAQPLRALAGLASRRLERAQSEAVSRAGGIAVPVGKLLSPLFVADPLHFAPDGFHPSEAGYRLIASYLLPPLLSGM
ncbi:MAG TPA: SGNH/GDSL hydrolase family protein [Mycobacteriales bacterium]|nr:SGNH/GDSL hydrolase family protein [Mycobacteriales bacterium]